MSAAQFSDLPVELLTKIAIYLSLEQCVKLECVNSVLREVMLRQWKRKTSVDFGEFISANAILSRALHEQARIENGAEQQPPAKKRRVTQKLVTWMHSLCQKIGPHIEEIKIGYEVNFLATEYIISEIISVGAPNLTTLNFKDVDPAQLKRVVELPQISDLRIEIDHDTIKVDSRFFRAMKKVLRGLSHLKHLRLHVHMEDSDAYSSYDSSSSGSDSDLDGFDAFDYIAALISYIPSRLHSLDFSLSGDVRPVKPVSAFEKLHSENLQVLHWDNDLEECFVMDARNFPNLQELRIDGVNEVHNLKTLKHLEKLSFMNVFSKRYASWLKTITSDDCEFRSSLLELSLVWERLTTRRNEQPLYVDVPLSKLALLPSLRSLTFSGLPRAEADRMLGLKCIGEACSQLNELKIWSSDLGEAELVVIAASFPNLNNFWELKSFRHEEPYELISLEVLQRFVNLIPADRKMKIRLERGPHTDKVEEAGILTTFPNIDYSDWDSYHEGPHC